MQVKEVAKLVGITARTLHHYDEIGLLIPSAKTAAGYRIYSGVDLERLQEILFFRELGFSLKEIKKIMQSPTYQRKETLIIQRDMLQAEANRVKEMIKTINKTLKELEGEIEMTNEEKFVGFDFSKNPYEKEARKTWGDQAIDNATESINQFTAEGGADFTEQFNAIFRELAKIRHLDPASNIAQEQIKGWYQLLNEIGNYSPAAFKGLGELYLADERFTENIDQFGEGLAEFMAGAMRTFAEENA